MNYHKFSGLKLHQVGSLGMLWLGFSTHSLIRLKLICQPKPQFSSGAQGIPPSCLVVVVGQLLSHVWIFETPWTAACQAFLSFTIFQSLLELTFIESVMTSNHLILCRSFSSCHQSFPVSGSFPMSWLFASGGHSIGASASASVLLMSIQDAEFITLSLEDWGLPRWY